MSNPQTKVYIAFDLTASGGSFFALDDPVRGVLDSDYVLPRPLASHLECFAENPKLCAAERGLRVVAAVGVLVDRSFMQLSGAALRVVFHHAVLLSLFQHEDRRDLHPGDVPGSLIVDHQQVSSPFLFDHELVKRLRGSFVHRRVASLHLSAQLFRVTKSEKSLLCSAFPRNFDST